VCVEFEWLTQSALYMVYLTILTHSEELYEIVSYSIDVWNINVASIILEYIITVMRQPLIVSIDQVIIICIIIVYISRNGNITNHYEHNNN